jgi:Tfp pilus assembly pilus retraction ATPase PilT
MNAIQTGQSVGMQSLDKCLAEFVNSGFVSLDDALEKTSHPEELQRMCNQGDNKVKFVSGF